MMEEISWGFTIPAFIILCLICVIVWLVQDRNELVRLLKARMAFVQRDMDMATDEADVEYYAGIIEGLGTAVLTIEKGKTK